MAEKLGNLLARWLKRSGSSLGILLRAFMNALPVGLFIILGAIVSLMLWNSTARPTLMNSIQSPDMSNVLAFLSVDKVYLIGALDQLSDWVWKSLLLGAFAILVYEQIKHENELRTKLAELKEQVIEIQKKSQWQRLDDTLQEYKSLGTGARDPELSKMLADGFVKGCLDTEFDLNWTDRKQVWLNQALDLNPKNSKASLLQEFAKHLETVNVAKTNECLDSIPEPLWAGFLAYHRALVLTASTSHSELQKQLVEKISPLPETILKANWKHYVLRQMLKEETESETKDFLQYFDENLIEYTWIRKGGLRGVAEQEPNNLFAAKLPDTTMPPKDIPVTHFLWDAMSPGDISVTHFLRHAALPKNRVILGDNGSGKTFLLRQLEFQANHKDSRRLLFEWTSLISVMETDIVSVPAVLTSLIQDARKALQKDDRCKDLLKMLETSKPLVAHESNWREQLALLKDVISSAEISWVMVGVDNLYEYPEIRRDPRKIESLFACFLRPEVMSDVQPWFLYLFMPHKEYNQIYTGLNVITFFDPLLLSWDKVGLRQVAESRLEFLLKLGAPKGLAKYAEPKFIDTLLERGKTPRTVITDLERALKKRAKKYKESNFDPDFVLLDENDLAL